MPNTKAMKPSIINASTDTQRITNNTKKASEASNVFFALSFGSLFFFDLMKYTMPSTSKTKIIEIKSYQHPLPWITIL